MEMDLDGELPEGMDEIAEEMSAAATPCTLEPRVQEFVKLVRVELILPFINRTCSLCCNVCGDMLLCLWVLDI